MKQFRTILLYASLIYAFSTCSAAISGETKLSEHEAYLLLDSLLNLHEISTDHKTQLAQYKEWEKLRVKFNAAGELTKTEMKLYLFMAFIADEKNKVHSQEEIAKEIKPLFLRQSKMMLVILSELPFLIPSACGALSDHFALFSNKNEKRLFTEKYGEEIIKSLGKDRATICLSKLKS